MAHPTDGMSPFRKKLWRFGKVLEYTLIHGAVLFGTSLAYAYILPVFVTLLEDPETPDKALFTAWFWPSILISTLVAIKETSLYQLFFYDYWALSDEAFETWLTKHYSSMWSSFSKSNAILKSILGGMSLGVTAANISKLASANLTVQRMLAGIGVPVGGVLYWLQTRLYYTDEHHNFNGPCVMATSFGISLPSVTNYVMGIFLHLEAHKELSYEQRVAAYSALGVYSGLLIYYYTRMYYELQVKKATKIDPTIKSCFGRLEHILKQSIKNCCSEEVQELFSPIVIGLDYFRRTVLIGGVISGGLLFGMWSAWRGVAVNTGWIQEEELELYPKNNLFDIATLCLLGLGNLLVRFNRFDITSNRMLHNHELSGYKAIA